MTDTNTSQRQDSEEALAALSEIKIANKIACVLVLVMVTIISLAYILEVVKGNRGVPYVLGTVALGYIPSITGLIYFYKNPQSEYVKHIVIYGFCVLYTYLLFSAQNDLVFTYIIPVMVIVILYDNFKFSATVGSIVIAENILNPVVKIVGGHVESQDIVTIEIQVLLILIIIGFIFVISYTSVRFQKIKVARINLEKAKADNLLQRVLSVSGSMIQDVSDITTQMNTLEGAVFQTMDAMSEVSAGTNESAESIQNQLEKTEEIQRYITDAEEASNAIASDMQDTTEAALEGEQLIQGLQSLALQAEDAGNDVADALKSFREYTNQMNSITELITSVASQTSLLALNASIEAARAGEAGKGFAVVASEISNLAGQTTSATADIVSLINNISSQLKIMIDTIGRLIDSNREQSDSATKTGKTFEMIQSKITNINDRAQELNQIIIELSSANKTIVSSIQTISAITQEVSAHTNETYESSERNKDIVHQVHVLVDSLNQASQTLQN